MATKTFSGRADAYMLEVAEEVVRRKCGMSFGQYCSNEIVKFVFLTGDLPSTEVSQPARNGIETMKALARKHADSPVSHMSDEEIRELMAARYE